MLAGCVTMGTGVMIRAGIFALIGQAAPRRCVAGYLVPRQSAPVPLQPTSASQD